MSNDCCERCEAPLVEIDHYGERLTGCPRWQASTGEWCRLATDDIVALRALNAARGETQSEKEKSGPCGRTFLNVPFPRKRLRAMSPTREKAKRGKTGPGLPSQQSAVQVTQRALRLAPPSGVVALLALS
jgi:hypothetical protein